MEAQELQRQIKGFLAGIHQAAILKGAHAVGNLGDIFLGCQVQGERVVVDLASDSLSLADKELVEAHLNTSWVFHHLGKPWINFRRRQPLGRGNGAGTTMPPPVRSGAISGYGIKPKQQPLPGVDRILVVYSAKGGVGKSTTSCLIARYLQQMGFRVGILDADLQGPSVPGLLGVKGPVELAANSRIVPKECHGIKVMSFGFFNDGHSPFMSRGPVVTKSLNKMIFQTDWGLLDYLVIDMPPGTGDVPMTVMEELLIDGAVLVSTPQGIALLDAHKGLSLFEKLDVPVLGMIENMSMHTCSQCGHQEPLFGNLGDDFVRERHLPMLARIPIHRQLADQGFLHGEDLVINNEIDDLLMSLTQRISDLM